MFSWSESLSLLGVGSLGCGKSLSLTQLLCHSRDVHPTWVKSFTETLGSGSGVLSTRAKSEEDFDSY